MDERIVRGVADRDSDDAGGNGNAVDLGALGRRQQRKLEKRRRRILLKARRTMEEGQEEESTDGKERRETKMRDVTPIEETVDRSSYLPCFTQVQVNGASR